MVLRRRVLQVGGSIGVGSLSGCTLFSNQSGTQPTPVEVRLANEDKRVKPVTIIVKQNDTTVFRTETRVPAWAENDLGRVSYDAAFSGMPSDQFTVTVRLDGATVRTYDYTITCPSDESETILLLLDDESTYSASTPINFRVYGCQ